ncbi:MAG: relaxase/mobilization nuclease domain-containing protein [Amphritea sp.]
MIAKGNQRTGGQQLASHLMNQCDNERVEIVDVRGSVAQDLHGAFAEWEATAKGTRCKKYLYSLSVNPDPRQRPLTREEFFDYIDRTERALGLDSQPRAVVFHEKHGRLHSHVAWSRIDINTMKAVHIAHDRQKLRRVSRDFANAHDLQLPEGLQQDKGLSRFNDNSQGMNLAEKQQEERSGLTKTDRVAAITVAYQRSDSGQAFFQALEEAGFYLARGDKRGYVVVDRAGEIHSLTRQVRGAKAKEIRARLADYPAEKLPDAAKAQDYARQIEQARDNRLREAFNRHVNPVWTALQQRKEQRRTELDAKYQTIKAYYNQEQDALYRRHFAENRHVRLERYQERPQGLAAFLGRISGIQAYFEWQHRQQDQKRRQKHRKERQELTQHFMLQSLDLQRHFRAVSKIEAYERKTLINQFKRAQWQPAQEENSLSLRQLYKQNVEDIVTRQTVDDERKDRNMGEKDDRSLSRQFSQTKEEITTARPGPLRRAQSWLSAHFFHAANPQGSHARQEKPQGKGDAVSHKPKIPTLKL